MKVLFVCRGNVGRSQMAEGFFNHYAQGHEAISSGYNAVMYSDNVLGKEMGWDIVQCMDEKGIDLRGKRPKQLLSSHVDDIDKIIWMAEKDQIPGYAFKPSLSFWEVDDPSYLDYEGHCRVKDEIEGLVKKLINELE